MCFLFFLQGVWVVKITAPDAAVKITTLVCNGTAHR